MGKQSRMSKVKRPTYCLEEFGKALVEGAEAVEWRKHLQDNLDFRNV